MKDIDFQAASRGMSEKVTAISPFRGRGKTTEPRRISPASRCPTDAVRSDNPILLHFVLARFAGCDELE